MVHFQVQLLGVAFKENNIRLHQWRNILYSTPNCRPLQPQFEIIRDEIFSVLNIVTQMVAHACLKR